MGVPKRRTSQAKQGLRRSHHNAATPSIVRDPRTGQWKLSHGISRSERDRKGRPLGEPGAPRS
ncbi:MAG: 50S ribosomal protein L32 [Dehalococcoidia bacterium]|nr:50S ribosomal protein L32 [Dehalococcoidia bacterium]